MKSVQPFRESVVELRTECAALEQLAMRLLDDLDHLREALRRKAHELDRQRSESQELRRLVAQQQQDLLQQRSELRQEIRQLRELLQQQSELLRVRSTSARPEDQPAQAARVPAAKPLDRPPNSRVAESPRSTSRRKHRR